MKIAYDAKRIFNNRTGLGNYGRTLVHNFLQTFPQEEVALFTPYQKLKLKDEFFFHSAQVIMPQKLQHKIFPSLWRSLFIREDIKNLMPDIFHGLSHEIPLGLEKVQVKKIVTIHDLIYLRYPRYFSAIDRFTYDKKFRYASEYSDGIIAICEQTAQDLVEFFGIKREKIKVIYQAINDVFYEKSSTEEIETVRKTYGLPSEFLLFVGTLEERKNAKLIVHALDALKGKIDIPFVIVGEGGRYKNELKELIHEKGLCKRTHFLGHVDFQHLPTIYQLATIFVFPSFFEGFGLPIVESLASGTPVITSKGSCFPEAGGKAALYIDPLSVEELSYSIEKVLTDEKLRETLVDEGKEQVKKFDGKKLAKELFQYYQQILLSKN